MNSTNSTKSTNSALNTPSFFASSAGNQGSAQLGHGMPQGRSTETSKAPSNIVIENGKLRIRIAIENIVFVKAEHVYINIHCCNEQRILQRGSLSGLLAQLPKDQFVQVHRSYIVNLAWVERWTKSHIIIGGKRIPISRSRQEEVMAIMTAN